MRKEIDPIERQQADHRDSRHVFFRDGPIHDSQPRHPASQYDRGIEIESEQPTEHAQNSDEHQAAATDYDWEQNRYNGLTGVGFMGARQAHALEHDVVDRSD